MTENKISGYEEKEHTADWELHVWGENLSTLLTQAATGMNALAGIRLDNSRRASRSLSLNFSDAEELLVSFLSEVLFIAEMEGMGFDEFELSFSDGQMTARLSGAPIISFNKEIKAVTYHNLRIETSPQGLEAYIVFDV
jgi:SHS2 domain-containing protein